MTNEVDCRSSALFIPGVNNGLKVVTGFRPTVSVLPPKGVTAAADKRDTLAGCAATSRHCPAVLTTIDPVLPADSRDQSPDRNTRRMSRAIRLPPNYTQVARSANPALSDTAARTSDRSAPARQVTASAVTTDAVAVHMPRICQSLFAPPRFTAHYGNPLEPGNADLKVTCRLSVNVLPPAVTVVAARIAHWLLPG